MKKRLQDFIFTGLWRLVACYPGTIITAGIVLTVVSALFAFSSLKLDSDQDRLVSPEVPFQKRYLENLKNFGDQEYLYIVIKAGGTEEGQKKSIRFAERIASRLALHPDLIPAIYYKITAKELGDGTLLYASPEDAETLAGTMQFLTPSLYAWFEDGSLAGFLVHANGLLHGIQGTPLEFSPAVFGPAQDRLGSLLERINITLAGNSSEEETPFGLDGIITKYFFTSNGQLLIMRILPAKDYESMDVIGKPLKAVRQALAATRSEFPDVEAGLTGRPVLQADEMQTTNKDTTKAAVIAFVLVGLLFMVVLHGWLRPMLVLISLTMAIAWTFGFATLTVGYLNLLSIVFTLVLVGIGVDFGIHIVLRYLEAREQGLDVEGAVRTTLLQLGPGVIMAGLTSVCAFYAVIGSDFLGLAELGQIGGTGILLCLLAMMTVLPAMILIAGKKNMFPKSSPRISAMPFLERLSNHPKRALLILTVLTLAGIPGLFKTGFNYNLLDLQARGLESVKYEKYLSEASDESTWYAILTADNLAEVSQKVTSLKVLPSVGKVESVLDFIPKDQAQKMNYYAGAVQTLAGLPPLARKPASPDPNLLIPALARLSRTLEQLKDNLLKAGGDIDLTQLDQNIKYIRSSMEILEQDKTRAVLLTDLQNDLRQQINRSLQQLKRWLNAKPVTAEDLPEAIRNIFVGLDGRYQIKVSPSNNVWDYEKLKSFVADLRQVDSTVSGVPVGVLESARLMHRSFLSAAGLTLILVCLILWLASRSVLNILLTLLPLGVGIIWLLTLMGWLGLNLNLANFFAIPILIAIGVDGGIHMLARWHELNGQGRIFSTSTPTAIILSFTTTMIGFGGLLFAHHRGLASLGAVMVIGSLTCMLATLLVLPPVLKLLAGKR